MIEFEIEELERSLAGNDGYKEQERSADNTSNLEEEGIPIFEEIAEMLEGRKTSYQFLEIYQKEKETKIDKILCKHKIHSTTTANELFYVGAVVTFRLSVKINKATDRKVTK